jgi:hypothetical protein
LRLRKPAEGKTDLVLRVSYVVFGLLLFSVLLFFALSGRPFFTQILLLLVGAALGAGLWFVVIRTVRRGWLMALPWVVVYGTFAVVVPVLSLKGWVIGPTDTAPLPTVFWAWPGFAFGFWYPPIESVVRRLL